VQGGAVSWYLTDHQGSVRRVLDNSGAVSGTLAYDAFGKATTATGLIDRYRFTAREWDHVLNLQYSRARVYDVDTGRWLTVDPLGFAAGDTNLYRYVGNRATTSTDPSGLYFFVHAPNKDNFQKEFLKGIKSENIRWRYEWTRGEFLWINPSERKKFEENIQGKLRDSKGKDLSASVLATIFDNPEGVSYKAELKSGSWLTWQESLWDGRDGVRGFYAENNSRAAAAAQVNQMRGVMTESERRNFDQAFPDPKAPRYTENLQYSVSNSNWGRKTDYAPNAYHQFFESLPANPGSVQLRAGLKGTGDMIGGVASTLWEPFGIYYDTLYAPTYIGMTGETPPFYFSRYYRSTDDIGRGNPYYFRMDFGKTTPLYGDDAMLLNTMHAGVDTASAALIYYSAYRSATTNVSLDGMGKSPVRKLDGQEFNWSVSYSQSQRVHYPVGATSPWTPPGTAASSPLVSTLGGRTDSILAEAAKIPERPGWNSVACHSNGRQLMIRLPDGRLVELTDAEGIAHIKSIPGYRDDWPLRLICCDGGKFPDGIGFKVAEALKRPVDTPTSWVWPQPDGSLVVHPGTFREGAPIRLYNAPKPSRPWFTFGQQYWDNVYKSSPPLTDLELP
jgi:RHS repeat-associated protein